MGSQKRIMGQSLEAPPHIRGVSYWELWGDPMLLGEIVVSQHLKLCVIHFSGTPTSSTTLKQSPSLETPHSYGEKHPLQKGGYDIGGCGVTQCISVK